MYLDAPTVPQLGQATDPGHPLSLHSRIEIPHEHDVDVAVLVSGRWVQKRRLPAEEVRLEHVGDAFAGQQLLPETICEDEIAPAETEAISVPLKIPVSCQSDDRHSGRPKAIWNLTIGQPKHHEIRSPIRGKIGEDCFPS